MTNKKAFTLIELLVVVLIIAILAAIALPQYYKAVRRAKAAEILTLIKAVADAQAAYQLATGAYAVNFDNLDIAIPGVRKAVEANQDYFILKDFEIALKNQGADVYGIYIKGDRPLIRINVKTRALLCCSSIQLDPLLCGSLGAIQPSAVKSEGRDCWQMP